MAIITLNNNSLSGVTALPAGVGGKVLQVVSISSQTVTTTTSTSFVNSSLQAVITPSSTSSKILINITSGLLAPSAGTYAARYTIFRGDVTGTNLGNSSTGFLNMFDNGGSGIACFGGASYLDAPNTVSATTYTFALRSEGNNQGAVVNASNSRGTITLMEIAG